MFLVVKTNMQITGKTVKELMNEYTLFNCTYNLIVNLQLLAWEAIESGKIQ